jgi:hypothetical protein
MTREINMIWEEAGFSINANPTPEMIRQKYHLFNNIVALENSQLPVMSAETAILNYKKILLKEITYIISTMSWAITTLPETDPTVDDLKQFRRSFARAYFNVVSAGNEKLSMIANYIHANKKYPINDIIANVIESTRVKF